MATDDGKHDRERDRTEAAFDALASSRKEPPAPGSGNPWKPAALLLLLMALALPLAFGIRASRVRIEFEGRVAEAERRVAEVQARAQAGDLPAAIDALAGVIEALADVKGAPEATRAVREVARRRLSDLETERARVAERDGRLDHSRRVVLALLAGEPREASRLVAAGATSGALEESLERLSLRLDAFCMAYTVEGQARVSALELLATAWKLPAVKAERARAAAAVEAERTARGHLELARAAREGGDVAGAREHLELACRAKGLSGIAGAFEQVRRREVLDRGQLLSDEGEHAEAAACYRLAGEEGLAEAERGKAAIRLGEEKKAYLVERLRQRLAAAPKEETRAAIALLLAEFTGDPQFRGRAAVHAANGLLARARAFRQSGLLEAARALAAAAKGAEGVESFRKSVTDELARNAAAERVKQAEAVLTLGGPAYAAYLVAQNPEIPAELLRHIRDAQRTQALTEARARFDRGDLTGARDALEGQPADDPAVRELHRRLILATDDGDFVVEMPKDQSEAEALLTRAVLHRFRTDPVAAGRILATYEESPAKIVPDLAAFLDAADDAKKRALWQAVKAEVEKRFPQPAEPK